MSKPVPDGPVIVFRRGQKPIIGYHVPPHTNKSGYPEGGWYDQCGARIADPYGYTPCPTTPEVEL